MAEVSDSDQCAEVPSDSVSAIARSTACLMVAGHM
jgi:hypothetical protein